MRSIQKNRILRINCRAGYCKFWRIAYINEYNYINQKLKPYKNEVSHSSPP